MSVNEKLIINTNLLRKEPEFKIRTCVVEKAIAVPNAEFDDLKRHPLRDNKLIAENVDIMYCDRYDHYHCLLIESEGYEYARYAQFIPRAKEIVERHQNPEMALTNGEKKLHKLLIETADRIEVFTRFSYSEFSLDDVLQDLGCDLDEVKKMLVEAVAEILDERNDIKSVRVNDLDIPFQPDITVESEEPDMGMTM